jgi:serine protease Do
MVALLGAVLGSLLVTFVLPSYFPAAFSLEGPAETEVEPPLSLNQGGDEPQPAPGATPPSVLAVEKAAHSVVGIINKAQVYNYFSGRSQIIEQGSGSGVILDGNGHIVTNHHVVDGAAELVVVLPGGEDLPAQVVGVDPATDLAVVKVDQPGLRPAEFGDSGKLRVGEPVLAIGNPVDMEFQRSVTAGVVSGLNRKIQYGERTFLLIQTDAVINPGNSGGPLVNMDGQVIGINTLKLDLPRVEGMGFSIPSNTVRRVADELIQHGRVIRPWLGVGVVTRETAEVYGIQFDRGLYVGQVAPGGPAASAGMKEGDVILSVQGRRTDSLEELRAVIETHKVGDVVEVRVRRDDQETTLSVRLGEMPVS